MIAHIPGLRRYARALTGNADDAEDLVQECLARTLARDHLVARAADARAYIYAILHNIHVDHVTARRQLVEGVCLEDVERTVSCPAGQLERLAVRDLEVAMAQLPHDQREVVLMVGLKGMSYRDVSRQLGAPLGTVMSRLSRARGTLRRLLAGRGDGQDATRGVAS